MVSAEKHLNIWKNDFFNGNLVASTTVDLFWNVYINLYIPKLKKIILFALVLCCEKWVTHTHTNWYPISKTTPT